MLRPGGRLHFLAIHVADGLDAEGVKRGVALGPNDVASAAPLSELLAEAGFDGIERRDVTASFAEVCRAILSYRAEHEDDLRAAEGDEEFDRQVGKKSRLVRGVEEGVLRRSAYLAVRPVGAA